MGKRSGGSGVGAAVATAALGGAAASGRPRRGVFALRAHCAPSLGSYIQTPLLYTYAPCTIYDVRDACKWPSRAALVGVAAGGRCRAATQQRLPFLFLGYGIPLGEICPNRKSVHG